MAKTRKYYVVWKGRIPGIYQTWAEALDQVDKYEGAVYKGFESLDAAREAYENDFRKYVGNKTAGTVQPAGAKKSVGQPMKDAIAVDAACSGNPGPMEYQGVFVKTGQRLFHQGPFEQGTNNVGEFLALVHACAYCKKNNITCPIYTDSANAMIWVNQKKAKTKLFKTAKNEVIFDLIERAEYWLKNNTIDNKILKWETEAWGEIPADFGRK
jgi:ribonuclease HI